MMIMIIFEYQKDAKWSNKFKGKLVKLNGDQTIAKSIGDKPNTQFVRADFPILKGQIISWELDCVIKSGINL